MKTILLSIVLIILGMYIGMLVDRFFLNQSEYHLQLLDYDNVEIMDDNHEVIKTTTLDSIGYYLEQDNI